MALEEPIYLDMALREEFLTKSNYNPGVCYQCGTCTATCPLNGIHEEKLTIRKILHKAQLGLQPDKLVWECSSCKLCEVRCPRQVDIVGSFRMLRNYSYRRREMPKEFETLLWNILEESNPSGEAKSNRTDWMKGLNIKDANDAKIMLYVGGSSSYDPRLQKIARAMTSIMDVTKQDFGVLGKKEPSSGEAVLEIGDDAYLEHLVETNVELFNKTSVEMIVPISPHSYNIMKHIYPQFGLEAEVMHYTEYLDMLWQQNKLKFKNNLDMNVTYHDPCYLGRYNGVFDEPRNLIEAIPGVVLTEMDETKSQAICCGGGGNQIYRESESDVRLSDVRVKSAAETGATNMVTSCGYCIQNFEDSSKTTGKNIQINDLIELINLSTGGKI